MFITSAIQIIRAPYTRTDARLTLALVMASHPRVLLNSSFTEDFFSGDFLETLHIYVF